MKHVNIGKVVNQLIAGTHNYKKSWDAYLS